MGNASLLDLFSSSTHERQGRGRPGARTNGEHDLPLPPATGEKLPRSLEVSYRHTKRKDSNLRVDFPARMALHEALEKLGDVTFLFIKHHAEHVDLSPLHLFFDFLQSAFLRALRFD